MTALTCALPTCDAYPDHLNRAEQRVCVAHVAVVVGRDVADSSDLSEAME